ncbi:unnamed protein product, partial [Rotaria sp. Silwood2]
MGCIKSTAVGIQNETETLSKHTQISQGKVQQQNKRGTRLPSLETFVNNTEQTRQPISPLSPTPKLRNQTRILSPDISNESSHSEYTYMNVLLLGESGVGKSTFINAIVNYIKFDKLEQARSGQPIVLMPVSFLLTVGDNFDERIVKFGDEDPNEDHDHPG